VIRTAVKPTSPTIVDIHERAAGTMTKFKSFVISDDCQDSWLITAAGFGRLLMTCALYIDCQYCAEGARVGRRPI
jgi:hypothetical protein